MSLIKYDRVAPRDLFNESKLLKCMGKLVIHLENEFRLVPIDSHYKSFDIRLNRYDNTLHLVNIQFIIEGKSFILDSSSFFVPYSSKDQWPLKFHWDWEDHDVLDSDGELDYEFKVLLKGIIQ